MKNSSDLKNKKIAILGLGIENQALVEFLIETKTSCEIVICDQKAAIKEKYQHYKKEKNINWQLGANYNQNLEQYDIIFRVAGYPLFDQDLVKARERGVVISSPTKLFFDICPSKNIIGITGTKGKGTTSALVVEIFRQAGKNVFWAGNIGIPMFGLMNNVQPADWVVLELSSFQLEDLEKSPHIGAITNFSAEHLAPADPNNPNYHKNLEDYWRAKANIFRWQKANDYLVLNRKLAGKIKKERIKSKIVFFTQSKLSSRLPGEHNKENIALAETVARMVGIEDRIIKKAVNEFGGLEHRLEFVGNLDKVEYYNDSFATTPEAAITAIDSFKQPIILLAGGAEKNSDFAELARIISEKVKFLILFEGKATPRLKREAVKAGFAVGKTIVVSSMNQAFRYVDIEAAEGDVVLLSPACASFGVFNNYKERGEQFKKEIKKRQA